MRVREAVASALHLLVILSYVALGGVIAFFPRQLEWQVTLHEWLEKSPELFYLSGAAFVSLGLFFLLGFYFVGRGKLLRLSMEPHSTFVHARLLEKAIEEAFKPRLRGVNVAIVSNQVDVAIDSNLEDLKKIEEELNLLLRDRFGITKPITLSVRLKEEAHLSPSC